MEDGPQGGWSAAKLATAVAAAHALGCAAPVSFECADRAACNAGPGGTCQPDGLCSYEDPNCATGQRYGDFAGPRRHECVGGGDGIDGGGGGDGAVDGGGGTVDPTWTQGPGDFSCVLAGRRAACVGNNESGQLGNDPTAVPSSTALIEVGGGIEFTAISGGDFCACGIDAAGAVSCWGSDSDGCLGNGAPGGDQPTPGAVLGLPGPALQIATGDTGACAVIDLQGAGGDNLYCWGVNSSGQGGRTGSSTTIATVPTDLGGMAVASVGFGEFHACAVTTAGALYCWGKNDEGAVTGIPVVERLLPTLVRQDVRKVVASDDVTCALDGAGAVSCWGDDGDGQHGDGVAGDGAAPSTVALPGPASDVLLSERHGCALLATGAVWCWGKNAFGQASGGATSTLEATPLEITLDRPARAIGSANDASCATLDDGTLTCWGKIVATTGRTTLTFPP